MENSDIYALVESQGAWAMSDFQSRYFVVNSQVTDYRRVRQALLEIETRIAAKKQMERSIKRTLIEKQIKKRDYDHERDHLGRELILVDIEQLDYDLSVYEKKFKVCVEEIEVFTNIVKSIVPDIETLKEFSKVNEEEEKKYWITRMAKQAATDMFATGRIGQGNLDSIAMMPVEDQQETIKGALKYNGMLSKGIGTLERTALEEIAHTPTGIKYISDMVGNQHKLEGKIKGEDI